MRAAPGDPLNIRQCIPADLENTQAFLREVLADRADSIDLSRIDHCRSLTASDDGTIVAVALCESPSSTGERRVFVIVRPQRPELLRLLVDKAVSKLHMQGVHKFKMVLHDGSEPRELWQSARWTGTMADAPLAAEATPAPKKKKAKATPAAAA